jgi:hypothetical protein
MRGFRSKSGTAAKRDITVQLLVPPRNSCASAFFCLPTPIASLRKRGQAMCFRATRPTEWLKSSVALVMTDMKTMTIKMISATIDDE